MTLRSSVGPEGLEPSTCGLKARKVIFLGSTCHAPQVPPSPTRGCVGDFLRIENVCKKEDIAGTVGVAQWSKRVEGGATETEMERSGVRAEAQGVRTGTSPQAQAPVAPNAKRNGCVGVVRGSRPRVPRSRSEAKPQVEAMARPQGGRAGTRACLVCQNCTQANLRL